MSARAAGCRNTILVIVVLAVVGFAWGFRKPMDGSILGFLANMVAATSALVLTITLFGLVMNLPRMLDWIVVRRPQVVHDPVLGDVTYEDFAWHAHVDDVHVSFEGRRQGPNPELMRAAADLVTRREDFERRTRAYAAEELPALTEIGPMLGARGMWDKEEGAAAFEFEHSLSSDPEDSLRVRYVGDRPTYIETPGRYDPRNARP